MKQPLSIAIMCKNAAAHIGYTIESVLPLSDDIVVYDTGSADATVQIAGRYPVHIYTGDWEGYGKTRNKALQKTNYDWVLAIDADEAAEPDLLTEIKSLQLDNPNTAYRIKLRNFLAGKEFQWGDMGSDSRIRLFNKQAVKWDEAIIHEKPVLPAGTKTKQLQGRIIHYNAESFSQYSQKLSGYAALTAQKYLRQGRRPLWLTMYVSPVYSFIRNYFLKGAFLDGKAGFSMALLFAQYTRLKYEKIREIKFRSLKVP